jgi:A/G-specific adenine glycosylase
MLLALPGIGPYTARAVLAFAFERDVAVVDTNIARVLARVGGERLTPKRAQRRRTRWFPLVTDGCGTRC